MVVLRALEVPQPDSGRRSRREHVYDPAASRLLHHGTMMSDKKSTDEKAAEEFDEEPVSYTHLTLPTNREV